MKSKKSGHSNISRRQFICRAGTGAAALLVPVKAVADFSLPKAKEQAWEKSVFSKGLARRYQSHTHTDARMHLGGISTGNIEIGADGQFTSWQLFNNLRDGYVPFHLAIKAGDTARLLQTSGGPGWPRVKHIEMTGEYPVAALHFQDEQLPVSVQLEAFTPFAPLDADFSSIPAVLLNFRLRNTTAQDQEVSLAAFMPNPIGYAAVGKLEGIEQPNLGWNINQAIINRFGTGILLTAHAGRAPAIDRPLTICVARDHFAVPPDLNAPRVNFASIDRANMAIPSLDRPAGLKVKVVARKEEIPAGASTLIWLDQPAGNSSVEFLEGARDAVSKGATLVFSGEKFPLIESLIQQTGGRSFADVTVKPDIVFEDFEGDYHNWTAEGDAFGTEPAHGPIGNQNPVSGYLGHGLVNTYTGADETMGKLTSREFKIERRFIRFLIGGGRLPKTQIRLVAGGKVVRTASGRDIELLEPAAWDVLDLAGQTAHIVIADESRTPWGHINIDQIVFSDAIADLRGLAMVDELMPIRCSGVRGAEFKDVQLRDQTTESKVDGKACYVRPFGRGKVVLVAGPILDAAHTEVTRMRQQTYATLCNFAGVKYTMTEGQSADALGYGSMALSAIGKRITGLAEFEQLHEAWEKFSGGGFPALDERATSPTAPGRAKYCALSSTVTVPAGGEAEAPFILTWSFPNRYSLAGEQIGSHYTTQWPDARTVMAAAMANYDQWKSRTETFKTAFYGSTLPYWLLEAAMANAATVRHGGVVFRIGNGDVYGWEGSNGSCPPTCTHVWGYEQALARLFPSLERDMRRIDYMHQQNDDGSINNRTMVPSPPHPSGEGPATDGHASCILKAYREALNCQDEEFFKVYWPHVKRAVDYLTRRDPHGQGVLEDRQWNTYDEALHGVTSFISGYYLAALRAGEEWAKRMGDTATAERYHGIFRRGQAKLLEVCWNGEYFQQDLPDYASRPGEIGPGCMADQLLGQWWAHQLNLGYILPEDKVKSALRAVFKYNFKSDLTGWKHSPRPFAGAGDKGLINCTWPRGGRPGNVMLYSDEVWTGVEYQVAGHLAYEGMLEESFAVAAAVRERYDGIPRAPIGRNPWCEVECGGHYVRAMSSWALLLALPGFHCDGPRNEWSFRPRYQPENFRFAYTGPQGWGEFIQKMEPLQHTVTISVKEGRARIQTLNLGASNQKPPSSVAASLAGNSVPAQISVRDGQVRLELGDPGAVVLAGTELKILLT